MSFGILQPVAFVLLLLVPYVIWVARKSYADLTRTRAKVLVVVRTSIIVLLAVALAHVILSAKQSDIPVSAVFCVDVSDSISDETREQAEAFVAEALKSRSTDDRAGIVAFGSRAVLVAPAGTDTTPAAIDRAAGADDTDIAAAIRLAALSLPEDTEKRIVVLTDGNPTRGDAELAAAEARTLGVRIDTFALASGTGPDVAVAELNLPAFVRKSQPFEVHVKLASSARTRTVVKLYVDGAEKPTQQKEVVLIGGGSSVTFPVEIKEEGAKRVRVETETARDARASNNTAQALVMVGPRPKVLLVANSTADAVYLSSALEKQACAYRIFSPEDLHKAYTPKVSQTANPREWVRSMARAERRQGSETDEPSGEAPAFPVLLAERTSFLYEVLTSLTDREIQNRLRREIAFCANRLVVADAEDISDIGSIRHALNRLFALANVGLLCLSRGDIDRAADVVAATAIKDLFQIGFSRAVDLRASARSLARKWWPDWRKRGFTLLERPDDEVLRGLMLRVPQYYAWAEGGSADFRDFRTMEEIDAVRMVLERIEVVGRAAFDHLGIPLPGAVAPVLKDVTTTGPEDLSLRNLVLTGFVRFSRFGRFEIAPLTPGDIEFLFSDLLNAEAGGGRVVMSEYLEGFLAYLAGTTGFDERETGVLRSFVESGVRDLEQEVGRVPAWRDLDPRYVRSLIFSRRPE